MVCSEKLIQDLGITLIRFAHYVSIDVCRSTDLIVSKSARYRDWIDLCEDQGACDAVTESVGVQVGQSVLFLYPREPGRDSEIFENVAYIMAYHADRTIPKSIDDWLDQFEMFSIYQILPEILELWGDNLLTDIKSKKELAEVSAK